LQAAQITTNEARALGLAAVIVNHSHYDHALDAPEVAKQTGAFLVGSTTTANIGRGAGVAEEKLRIVNTDGATSYCFARFPVTVVRTGHVGIDSAQPPAEIATALLPTTVGGFVEGGTYAIIIRHSGRNILVQGSAGFRPNALQGYGADVVYLAVGGLNPFNQTHADNYWNETAGMVSPRKVFMIHWDSLSGALSDAPSPIGAAGINMIESRAQAANVPAERPLVGQQHDPFAGL
jgi:L-ascorbate metabolism protein UlaG (beta-lactamase superfamily)